MGDPITTTLAIAQIGFGAVGAMTQASAARRQEQQSNDASRKQTKAIYSEVGRQQVEVNRIATEQASDRIRVANADLASARVAALERGVSGTTMSALVRKIGYLEGADLSRIEYNRKSNIDAGEASKASAKNGYIESVAIAANQRNVSTTSAMLGAVGSGLQIAGNFFNTQTQLNALQNTRV